jgi:hypothetical protein
VESQLIEDLVSYYEPEELLTSPSNQPDRRENRFKGNCEDIARDLLTNRPRDRSNVDMEKLASDWEDLLSMRDESIGDIESSMREAETACKEILEGLKSEREQLKTEYGIVEPEIDELERDSSLKPTHFNSKSLSDSSIELSDYT